MIGKGAKTIAVVLAFALCLAAAPAQALTFDDERPFDPSAFAAAQQAGKPILVHITAAWCSVCGTQKKILAALRAQEKFKPLLVFNVDFDSQKALVRRFRASAQSTMIVYKGKTEVGHFSGDTRPKGVELLLSRAF